MNGGTFATSTAVAAAVGVAALFFYSARPTYTSRDNQTVAEMFNEVKASVKAMRVDDSCRGLYRGVRLRWCSVFVREHGHVPDSFAGSLRTSLV